MCPICSLTVIKENMMHEKEECGAEGCGVYRSCCPHYTGPVRDHEHAGVDDLHVTGARKGQHLTVAALRLLVIPSYG